MIYKEKFKTGLKDIDKNNLIKNRAILEIFENIGSYHSDLVKFGANDIEQTKKSWILMDWKIQVIKRPKYGEILEVHTWCKDGGRLHTYRDYEIYNEKAELCVKGTSKWVLIDIETGKMTKIEKDLMDKYTLEEKNVFNEKEMDKLKAPEKFETSIEYKVNRKDIDINNHMHNLYYLDLAYEALPQEIYGKRPFNYVRISYKKEIKFGDIVECKYAKENEKNIVVITDKDNKVIHAIIELCVNGDGED